jgi:hypothetical protein
MPGSSIGKEVAQGLLFLKERCRETSRATWKACCWLHRGPFSPCAKEDPTQKCSQACSAPEAGTEADLALRLVVSTESCGYLAQHSLGLIMSSGPSRP